MNKVSLNNKKGIVAKMASGRAGFYDDNFGIKKNSPCLKNTLYNKPQ